jgi:hypothetical protein
MRGACRSWIEAFGEKATCACFSFDLLSSFDQATGRGNPRPDYVMYVLFYVAIELICYVTIQKIT